MQVERERETEEIKLQLNSYSVLKRHFHGGEIHASWFCVSCEASANMLLEFLEVLYSTVISFMWSKVMLTLVWADKELVA